MKRSRISGCRVRAAVFIGLIVVLSTALNGCVSVKEPLGTEQLQNEAKDPRVSIVLLHFKTVQLPPVPTGISEDFNRSKLRLRFAVANESTGWCFRPLEWLSSGRGQVFRTRDDSMEPDLRNAKAGWVTFLAPPGLTYIAVTTDGALTTGGGGMDLVAKPFADHISVEHSAQRAKNGFVMDYIDTARFAVQIPKPRSLIYAGTIIRTIKCGKGEGPSSTCPYELTVVDESKLAETFVTRYQKSLSIASPMQTKLLTIPQSRTIVIHDDPAAHNAHH